ncbi:MAG: gliding motility protein GldN [Bacteroidales bacterium]|nr:gliding motility protein GldN [Bacteroidales bacterium]
MVRPQSILLYLFLLFITSSLSAQIVGEEETPYDHFYQKQIIHDQLPADIPYLRENDVVWETSIWRTIDLRAKFNQCFYYPIDPQGVHGRKNFAYMLWDAIVNDQIMIFKDDECKIPIDNQFFVKQMTKGDTLQLEIIDEDENYEYKTIVVPHEFSSENILQIHLKEAWYIEKVDSKQNIRYLSLALGMNKFRTVGEQQINLGIVTLFWVPMLSSNVRKLLMQHESYYEDNIAHLPPWMYIFDTRRYESFVTQESNRFNRTIMSYLTGQDALYEAERIENKLLEISQDMWEW